MFSGVRATNEEIARELPGDDLVPEAEVAIDRAFTLFSDPAHVWPWFLQLGKSRAGWYLPASIERFIPRSRRGRRAIDERLLGLRLGDVIPDWGGRRATFTVARLEPPHVLVHRSQRGATSMSWAIVLRDTGSDAPATRVQLRVRLGPVRRPRLARSVGDWFDALTVAGLAAGLGERITGE